MSFFAALDLKPEDPILSIQTHYNSSDKLRKVNLGIGSYKDDQGQAVVLHCVRQAEKRLLEMQQDKEYQPIGGGPEFLNNALPHIFASHEILDSKAVYSAQTIGATGALRLGAELLKRAGASDVFLPAPSWSNHQLIFESAKFAVHFIPYYNMDLKSIDFLQLLNAIEKMNPGAVLVLQVACHNPSGADLTKEQWQELSEVLLRKKAFPFFDFSYHGFGNGFEEDAYPLRLFLSQGHEFAVAYSFSKNLSLYGERLGVFAVSLNSSKAILPLESHAKQIIRSSYSTPPLHGARLANIIFSSPELMKSWQEELKSMRERIHEIRRQFASKLMSKSLDFSFFTKQQGFFSFCGLTKDKVHELREKFGIFMMDSSRINIAGLTPHNMDYVVEAVFEVITAT